MRDVGLKMGRLVGWGGGGKLGGKVDFYYCMN